jgi:hypothetical protein
MMFFVGFYEVGEVDVDTAFNIKSDLTSWCERE